MNLVSISGIVATCAIMFTILSLGSVSLTQGAALGKTTTTKEITDTDHTLALEESNIFKDEDEAGSDFENGAVIPVSDPGDDDPHPETVSLENKAGLESNHSRTKRSPKAGGGGGKGGGKGGGRGRGGRRGGRIGHRGHGHGRSFGRHYGRGYGYRSRGFGYGRSYGGYGGYGYRRGYYGGYRGYGGYGGGYGQRCGGYYNGYWRPCYYGNYWG